MRVDSTLSVGLSWRRPNYDTDTVYTDTDDTETDDTDTVYTDSVNTDTDDTDTNSAVRITTDKTSSCINRV